MAVVPGIRGNTMPDLSDLVPFHSGQVEIHILINYYKFTCCIENSVDPGSTLLTKVDISGFILF